MTPSRTHEAAEKLLGNASFHVGRELRWVTGMAAARGGGARAPIHVYAGVEFLDMIAELVSPFESAHATTENAGGTTTVKTAEERRGDLADATLSLHSEPTVVNVLFCADPNGAARRGAAAVIRMITPSCDPLARRRCPPIFSSEHIFRPQLVFCSVRKLQPRTAGRISARKEKERMEAGYKKKQACLGDCRASDENDYVDDEWFAKMLCFSASAPNSTMMNRVQFPLHNPCNSNNKVSRAGIGTCFIWRPWGV